MKRNDRVRVIDELSLFFEREGVIQKVEKYYFVVHLDHHPYPTKFIEDELEIVTDKAVVKI